MLRLPASHKRCDFCQRSGIPIAYLLQVLHPRPRLQGNGYIRAWSCLGCKGKWHGSTAGGLVKRVSVCHRCYTQDYRVTFAMALQLLLCCTKPCGRRYTWLNPPLQSCTAVLVFRQNCRDLSGWAVHTSDMRLLLRLASWLLLP